jgi:hypothetical protein
MKTLANNPAPIRGIPSGAGTASCRFTGESGMLNLHDASAAVPGARHRAAIHAPDDWLAVPEDELRAAHAEACRMLAAAADAPALLRHARSVVLLEQLLAARAVMRVRGIAEHSARLAFGSDRALGYLFGLAASGGDPTAEPPTERALAAALRHVHGLVFGMGEARRIAEASLTEVGAPFGDGLLAAEADLHAFLAAHELRAPPTTPVGLLVCLPWAATARGGDPVARAH